jgi:hypothetical protein
VTIREAITRQTRKVQIVTFSGFGLFFLGILLSQSHKSFWPLMAVGFPIFFIGVIYQMYGIRCPRCSGRIGFASNHSAGIAFGKFQFCPFCGIPLDTQLDEIHKV